MKKLLPFLLLLSLSAQASTSDLCNVQFYFEDASSMPQPLRYFVLYPVARRCTNSHGAIVVPVPISRTTGTNASVTISNLLSGACGCYQGVLYGSLINVTNYYCFPITNGTVLNGKDWIGPPDGNGNVTINISTGSAGNAITNLDNRAGGVSINTNMFAKSMTVTEPGTNNWVALTNGSLWLPPNYIGGTETGSPQIQGGAIKFGAAGNTGPNQNGLAWAILNLVHRGSGSSQGQLLISHNNIALEEQGMGAIDLGNDGSGGGRIYVRQDDNFHNNLVGVAPGHSHLFQFATAIKDGSGNIHWSWPGFLAFHGGSTADSVATDPQSDYGASNPGEIRFYSSTPYPQLDSSLSGGVEVFRMTTNTVRLALAAGSGTRNAVFLPNGDFAVGAPTNSGTSGTFIADQTGTGTNTIISRLIVTNNLADSFNPIFEVNRPNNHKITLQGGDLNADADGLDISAHDQYAVIRGPTLGLYYNNSTNGTKLHIAEDGTFTLASGAGTGTRNMVFLPNGDVAVGAPTNAAGNFSTNASTAVGRFYSDVSMGGNLAVQGTADITNTLTARGSAAVSGQLQVTNAVTARSTLAVSGATSLSNTLNAQLQTSFGTNAAPETYNTNYHSFSLPGNSVAWSLVGDTGAGSNYVNVPMFGNSGWTNSAALKIGGVSYLVGNVVSDGNMTAAGTVTFGAGSARIEAQGVAGNTYAALRNLSTDFAMINTWNGSAIRSCVWSNGLWHVIGNSLIDTNLIAGGTVIATNGFTSYTNALAVNSFTFPATTVNWTNPVHVAIEVYIDNSGVTGTAIKKNGTQIFSSLVGDVTIGLRDGEYFSCTYSVGTPVGTWSVYP